MERKVTSKRIRATKTYKYVLKKLSIGLVSVAVGSALIVPASAILAQETDASTVQNPPAEGQTTDANGSVDDVTATTKDTPGTTDLPADNGRSSDMQTFAENTPAIEKGQSVVRIHYTANQGDSRKFYAWVWGDTAAYATKGRWEELHLSG